MPLCRDARPGEHRDRAEGVGAWGRDARRAMRARVARRRAKRVRRRNSRRAGVSEPDRKRGGRRRKEWGDAFAHRRGARSRAFDAWAKAARARRAATVAVARVRTRSASLFLG
ncbi:hypothetical protein X946_4785 [Burkholderia sp. ABCPW 111]|nr:hypothetical protein X946_4785 [Burkholderia sp. ABCPW 111]